MSRIKYRFKPEKTLAVTLFLGIAFFVIGLGIAQYLEANPLQEKEACDSENCVSISNASMQRRASVPLVTEKNTLGVNSSAEKFNYLDNITSNYPKKDDVVYLRLDKYIDSEIVTINQRGNIETIYSFVRSKFKNPRIYNDDITLFIAQEVDGDAIKYLDKQLVENTLFKFNNQNKITDFIFDSRTRELFLIYKDKDTDRKRLAKIKNNQLQDLITVPENISSLNLIESENQLAMSTTSECYIFFKTNLSLNDLDCNLRVDENLLRINNEGINYSSNKIYEFADGEKWIDGNILNDLVFFISQIEEENKFVKMKIEEVSETIEEYSINIPDITIESAIYLEPTLIVLGRNLDGELKIYGRLISAEQKAPTSIVSVIESNSWILLNKEDDIRDYNIFIPNLVLEDVGLNENEDEESIR